MSTKMMAAAFSIFGLMLGAMPAQAQKPSAPDAKSVLEQASEALKKIDSLSFSAELTPSGAAAAALPHIKGTVVQARAGEGLKFIVKASVKDREDKWQEMHVITDGERIANLLPSKKEMVAAGVKNAEMLMGPAGMLVMQRMALPDPFENEVDETLTLEADEKVDGVDCHVIRVVYAEKRNGMAKFHIGKADHMIRRVERVRGEGAAEGKMVLAVADLKTNQKIDDAAFSVKLPEGYKQIKFRQPGELLEKGEEAPDFTLKTPEGKQISLKKDLAGKVVMIDFWGTWCGPCKIAMPSIQKVHDHFKDNKNVAVYGISMGERPGSDPAAYMKKQKFTYGLLIEGEEAAEAYNVQGVPCFYVIGKDGKVIHSEVGLSDNLDKSLIEVMTAALKS